DVLLQVRPLLDDHARALLPALGVAPRAYALATVHRPSNTDDPAALRRIVDALSDLAMPVVFPAHPRTRQSLEREGIGIGARIRLVEPLGYLDMLTLQQHAHRIVTDSGGVQKEAFLLGVPCVTLRDETEWPETVDAGWNCLTGSRPAAIAAALRRPQ